MIQISHPLLKRVPGGREQVKCRKFQWKSVFNICSIDVGEINHDCSNPDPNLFYKIKNHLTQKYFEFRYTVKMAHERHAIQSVENNSTGQQFYFVKAEDANSYYILNRKSGKHLTYTASLFDLYELPCNLKRRTWKLVKSKNGTCKIVPTAQANYSLRVHRCSRADQRIIVLNKRFGCKEWTLEENGKQSAITWLGIHNKAKNGALKVDNLNVFFQVVFQNGLTSFPIATLLLTHVSQHVHFTLLSFDLVTFVL